MGEQIREAMMTGLPAHEAVQAIAAEPLTHPLLGVAPWLQGTALVVFLAVTGSWWFTGSFGTLVIAVALITWLVIPAVWILVIWLYRLRPKRILRALAKRLETGAALPSSLTAMMPRELRHVMTAEISDSEKARVAADLVPSLLGSNLRSQQFVMTLISPLIMLSIVMVGIHTMMLFIIPQFVDIFNDFGTDLPAMTEVVVGLSDLFSYFGTAGWVGVMIGCSVGVILVGFGLSSGWAAEYLETIPVVGITFRWAMQARLARILASMIRNDCAFAESLKTAAAGSGFQSVRQHGEMLAKEIEAQSGVVLPTRKLSGLPISMLFTASDTSSFQERKSAIAETFQSLSEMLDAATVGQGRLLAILIQIITVSFIGMLVVVCVLGMFLPLIKLLNDLS